MEFGNSNLGRFCHRVIVIISDKHCNSVTVKSKMDDSLWHCSYCRGKNCKPVFGQTVIDQATTWHNILLHKQSPAF